MRDVNIAITAASYSGNKGAAAMLQSSIRQLYDRYGHRLNINLMSVYSEEDKEQLPFDFIQVISCSPEKLLFLAFPLAILHRVFRWLKPIRKLIEKNKIIRTYRETDLVIDEAGISFVDSRGFIMNCYAFVCAAVPLLVGTPVVKYSQALGTFNNPINKLLAKWILPKLDLICARGKGTYENLITIGIVDNVRLCADGAFTMADSAKAMSAVDAITSQDAFYDNNVVGISLSSVVQKKCKKLNIDYKGIMIAFIDALNEKGYKVLIIANAARINSKKPRNNDLMICDEVYEGIKNPDMVRWYHREMDAEEIRSYIGICRCLVASRFHAMIGALQKKVPVLLVGWSHKYQEVLDMFQLGQYAIDFSNLNVQSLTESFEYFITCEDEIKSKLHENYDAVIKSSYDNIRYISEIIDEKISIHKQYKLFDYDNPDKYIGPHYVCRMGYANDKEIRENAASGGMVTALLIHLLNTGQIDGAWITRSDIKDGQLSYKTFIATTEEEVRACSSSIYMDMPLLKHLDLVRNFNGRVAVVLTPCLTGALNTILKKERELEEKIVLKLSLYCSGNHSEKPTLLSLEKQGISLENAERIYYRRGHWRGRSSIIYKDGSEKHFSYTKTICAYKNAYYFEKASCMSCQNHYGVDSDISFGDVWLKEMKSNSIKHTSCVIRNEKAYAYYQSAVDANAITDYHISDTKIIKSQKRALVFKYCCTAEHAKWNHRLAYYLAKKNCRYSVENYEKLRKLPTWLIYYYMCLIRVLLSF